MALHLGYPVGASGGRNVMCSRWRTLPAADKQHSPPLLRPKASAPMIVLGEFNSEDAISILLVPTHRC